MSRRVPGPPEAERGGDILGLAAGQQAGLSHQGEGKAGGDQAGRLGGRPERAASCQAADEQVQEDRAEEEAGGRGEENPTGEAKDGGASRRGKASQ